MANKDKAKPRVNYISQVNAFWDRILIYPLKNSSITVWFYFLHRNNKLDWKPQITVDHEIACQVIGITKNTFYTCRAELIDKGYIILEPAANRAFIDKISIVILYQNLVKEEGIEAVISKGIEAVISKGIDQLPDEVNRQVHGAEQEREPTGNLDKPLDLKPQILNQKSESKGALSDSFFSDFFLKNAGWEKAKCDKVAKKFVAEYSKKFQDKNFDWEAKAKKWIATEVDYDAPCKSETYIPDVANNQLYKSLSIADKKRAREKWSIDHYYQASGKDSQIGWHKKPRATAASDDWHSKLKTSIGAEKSQSLVPAPVGPRIDQDERTEQ